MLHLPWPCARVVGMVSRAVRDLEAAAQALRRAAEAAIAAAAVTNAIDRNRPDEAGDPGVAATNIAAALADADRALSTLRSTQRVLDRESTRRTEAARNKR